MYSMKPIYQNSENIQLPDVMYDMKNLHEKEQKEAVTYTPAMQALEDRQLNILKRLKSLETEVKNISVKLDHKYGDPAPKGQITEIQVKQPCKPFQLPEGTIDFVISVSPKQASLSPLLISELLKERGISVAVPTHLHSSCNGVPKTILDAYGGSLVSRINTSTTAKVFLTIIFKEDPFCPSVMYSPLLQTRIIGDVNIARYLCRILIPDMYNDADTDMVSVIDTWLDVSRQINHGSSKEKDAAMKTLNVHFGKKSDFLCNSCLTLADVAVLSALLSNLKLFKSLPKNIKTWFNNISTRFSLLQRFDVPAGWTTS